MRKLLLLSVFFILIAGCNNTKNKNASFSVLEKDPNSNFATQSFQVETTTTDSNKLSLKNNICEPVSSTLCKVDIQWKTTKNATVFVNGKLFSCTTASSEASASWIQKDQTYVFELFEDLPCTQSSYNNNHQAKLTIKVVNAPVIAPPITPPGQALGGVNMYFILDQYLGVASGSDLTLEYQTLTKKMAKVAMDDAYYAGIKLVRIAASGWGPVFYHANQNTTPLWIWKNNPQKFWQATDELLNDLGARQIKAVITLLTMPESAAGLTQSESIEDLFKNQDSQSYTLQKQFITEYVSRYKNHPAVFMWEIHNEMNLYVDLDLKTRCLDTWKDNIKDEQDKKNFCGTSGNFTTAEMNSYHQRVVAHIKSIDPDHKISSGHALPRPYAQHFVKQPEFSSSGPDWSKDTYNEFAQNLKLVNEPFDVISVHVYNFDITQSHRPYVSTNDKSSAEILDHVKKSADLANKAVYIGEYYDSGSGTGGYNNLPFTSNMLKKIEELKIPFHTAWTWEFYQFNTYDFQNDQGTAINIAPGFQDSFIKNLRNHIIRTGHTVYQPQLQDTTKPKALITWPINNMSTNDPRLNQAAFVHAIASDDSLKPVKVHFYSNGEFISELTKAPYRLSFNDIPLKAGENEIKITVFDENLNSAEHSIVLNKNSSTPKFMATSTDKNKLYVVKEACQIVSNNVCSVDIKWATQKSIILTVVNSENPTQKSIMACGSSNIASAPWIVNNTTYTFEMFESDSCSNSAIIGKQPVATMIIKNSN